MSWVCSGEVVVVCGVIFSGIVVVNSGMVVGSLVREAWGLQAAAVMAITATADRSFVPRVEGTIARSFESIFCRRSFMSAILAYLSILVNTNIWYIFL